MLTQAHTLATSTKDDDLVVLIDKWRTATRSAAEELFGTTRDRVNRMGGVGAWKDREKESKERQNKWDQEEREAEREKLEEARENGEVSDEMYDKYAENAEEQVEEEKETFHNTADDDVSRSDLKSARQWLISTVFHDGYDAEDSQHRFRADRIQQGGTALGRLTIDFLHCGFDSIREMFVILLGLYIISLHQTILQTVRLPPCDVMKV